ETLRYFKGHVERTGVDLRLNTRATADDLKGFDEVVLATGINPRKPGIEGEDRPNVLTYLDVLRDKKPVGQKVAIIGAGGIGFDVAEYLVHEGVSPSQDIDLFFEEWGVDQDYETAGGLTEPHPHPPARQVALLQRKTSKVGAGLGKTTGWIHRAGLVAKGVNMIPGVTYERIDDDGLHITLNGEPQVIAADTVVICAGQDPNRELEQSLKDAGMTVHLIGGADVAAELDAKRAINQGTRLAAQI
ncbi:NAD(P)/FAD-dependent oxidoreductase, partial [Brevundimonas sp.]